MRESIGIIAGAGAQAAGIAIALDRQERGAGQLSAAQEVQQEHGIPCVSIAGLNDLLQFLEAGDSPGVDIHAIHRYRERYGIQD